MKSRWRTLPIGLASLVTAALLGATWIPFASAGSSADAEVRDNVGDASPAAFAANSPENASLFENLTAYDLVAAWVSLESESDFWLFIRVRDLPDDWGALGNPPPQSPFGANTSFSGTSVVANFTVAGKQYQAIAKLAEVAPGGLMDNYSLWKGSQWAPLSGSYDVESDQIAMRLPKIAFENLTDGILLEKFWIQGRYGARVMDYAPDARDVVTGSSDPLDILGRLQQGKVTVEPRYGREYRFGQYYHPPAPGSSYSPPPSTQGALPDLSLSIIGSSERAIAAGDDAIYQLRIHNRAAAAETVYLVLSSAKAGWSNHLSHAQMQLGPGEADDVFITVAAAESARGSLTSRIDVSSSLGASKTSSVLTRVVESDPYEPGPQDDTVSPVVPPKGGSPSAGVLVAVAASGIALALARRRSH